MDFCNEPFSAADIEELIDEVGHELSPTLGLDHDIDDENARADVIRHSLRRDLNLIDFKYRTAIFQSDSLTAKNLQRAKKIRDAAQVIVELAAPDGCSVGVLDPVFLAGVWPDASPDPSRDAAFARISATLPAITELKEFFRSHAIAMIAHRRSLGRGPALATRARRQLYIDLGLCYEIHWARSPGITNPRSKRGETYRARGPFINFLVFTVGNIIGRATAGSVATGFKRAKEYEFEPIDAVAFDAWVRWAEENLCEPSLQS